MNSKLKNLLSWPLYPLLFAAYIPLNFFAHNLSLYATGDALRSLIVVPLLVGLFQALLSMVSRRPHFAALLSVLLIAYGVYFHSGAIADIPLIIGLLAICGLAFNLNIGTNTTRLINLAALAVLVQPLIIVVADGMSTAATTTLADSPFNELQIDETVGEQSRPTIVHIVLDAYASNETLSALFGHDNTPFTDELTSLGFIVGKDVRTPYNQTLLVMSSIFGGTYLKAGEGPLSVENPDHLRVVLGKLTTQGPLYKRLGEMGYSFLFVEPGYEFLGRPESAIISAPDIPAQTLNYFESDFMNFIFRLVPIHRLESVEIYKNIFLKHALTTDFYLQQKPPYLLYEHIISPHPPFVIDRDGNTTSRWEKFNSLAIGNHATYGLPELAKEYKEGYLEKLLFTNDAILQQIRKMLRDIPGPKIVLIHGDHGSGAHYYHELPEISCLGERYNTFLAVYADDPVVRKQFASLASERFNLVNIYRLIFDASFGTELGPLDDKSFFARWTVPQEPLLLQEEQISAQCEVAR